MLFDSLHDEKFLNRISGLSPEIWLSVGAGFSREDVKAVILGQGRGFVGDAVFTLQEIALKLSGVSKERVLSASSRQEILKTLLSEPRILSELHELKRIKRQRNFIRRLDLAIQSGRMTSAHEQEEDVYHERLAQMGGVNPLRAELRALAQAYEAWLGVSGYWDLPMVIREATRTLKEKGWPEGLKKPQEIVSLSAEGRESLEQEFWETLGQFVSIHWIQSLVEGGAQTQYSWQRWHTLDDAAEYFADQICSDEVYENWNHHAVLIPDIPVVRRSLNRALQARGLPLADPRDPTRLRWDESVKWALLPLEVVAWNYDRKKVISWLRSYQMQEEFPAWVNEIHARGIRHGLASYSGGMLAGIHSRLSELNRDLGGRKTCAELSEAHLKFLRANIGTYSEQYWLIAFLESSWKTFVSDFEKVGQASKKAPLYFWLERFSARLSEASPPVERLKPEYGIRIYRLQQAPLFPAKKLWIFGMPPYWLSGEGLGNYWFSEREREILSAEFSVRSSIQVREERLKILKAWMAGSEEVTILDGQYHPNGREVESILPILKELELSIGVSLPDSPVDRGSHSRFVKSYGVVRPLQPQTILLPALSKGPGQSGPELTATLLEHYSRCSFQALTYHRWNLKDVREPDIELWPEVKGKILHEAVRLLLESLDFEDRFQMDTDIALERAWHRHRPKGLIRNPRVEKYVKSKMSLILRVFCEKEREYLTRAGTQPYSLEDLDFRIEYPGFSVLGKPDRIDQYKDGLFIIDFKSTGSSPHGIDMIERGYRLQLPFYAIAAQKQLGKPVLGLQFVELTRKGNRRSGIFFKPYNGKESGKLTYVRSNSKSLIFEDPQEVWSRIEGHLLRNANSYLNGHFQAKPNLNLRDKECSRCKVADVCGWRRLVKLEEEEEEDHS